MGMMVSSRNYTLRTVLGHVIHFKAGEPTPVPPECESAALAVNIMPVDGKPVSIPESAIVQGLQINGTLRETILMQVISEMVQDNDPLEFDAGGRPKGAVMASRSFLAVSAEERNKLWDKWREIKGTNSDYPVHPKAALVREISALNTAKDIDEYAKLLEVDMEPLSGLTLKERKKHLLHKALAG